MKTCLKCFHNNNYALISSCYNKISDAIRVLNEKGYDTKQCCFGDTLSNGPSIVFQSYIAITPKAFSVLPNGFKLEISNEGALIINKPIHVQDKLNIHKDLLQASADLFEWSKQLEPAALLEADFLIDSTTDEMSFIDKVEKSLPVKLWYIMEDDNKVKIVAFSNLIDPLTSDEHKKEMQDFASKNDVTLFVYIFKKHNPLLLPDFLPDFKDLKESPIKGSTDSVPTHESTESLYDYDSTKWDPNLEVKYFVDFSYRTKNELARMKMKLEDNGFVTTIPIKDHKEYHCTAERKILVKDTDSIDKLVIKLFSHSPASVGHSQIEKFTSQEEKLGLSFS